MKKISLMGLALVSATLMFADKASAHMVQTDYLLSPDKSLSLDVTFSTGEPLADAPVKIYSPDNPNEPWMEGTTDEKGQFSFAPDQKLEGEWTVKIGEFSHADILSVPVKKNEGVQIDDISEGLHQTLLAQKSLNLSTQPAQAATSNQSGGLDWGWDSLIGLGAAGIGLALLTRYRLKR